MVEVIPAINAQTFEEVKTKIKMIEPFAEWAHLDIADGTFTPNTLWHQPIDLVGFETPLKLEIHMMEDDPEERIDHWFLPPVKRIIIHWETFKDFDFMLEECQKEGIELGMSISDQTSWTKLKPYAGKINFFQVLCVPPGIAGQEFHRHNLLKIKHLRALCNSCKIEVDGGINPYTAKEAVKMGANVIAAASHIFGSKDIKKAIEELSSL